MGGSLISLFCGAGGLDLGFEQAGFRTVLAVDRNPDSIRSYNHNRHDHPGQVQDVRNISAEFLANALRGYSSPIGLIGGPPCQSFSQANRSPIEGDPRHTLPLEYIRILTELNECSPIHFFMFENVTGLRGAAHRERLSEILDAFRKAGFPPAMYVLNAADYGVPQARERLIIAGFNNAVYPGVAWEPPRALLHGRPSVRSAIGGLPEPAHFRKELATGDIPHHPNHWCMTPKSPKFFSGGALREGDSSSRSFKTLAWDRPSITVAYGHREVHVHPDCGRRLSVYEAMKLQGFPDEYELVGSLSSQITQVSEAVPPPMAKAVAESILAKLTRLTDGRPSHAGCPALGHVAHSR